MSNNLDRYEWTRTSRLASSGETETWALCHGETRESFDIRVRFGKPLDFRKMRSGDFAAEIRHKESFKKYFLSVDDFVRVEGCPVCESPVELSRPETQIWGETYRACTVCSHLFLERFPSEKALREFYPSQGVQPDYLSQKNQAEFRVREVCAPKLSWICEKYRAAFGRNPSSLLEIGSGEGHMLHHAKVSGLTVAGIEPNRAYRKNCEAQFGVSAVGDFSELPMEESYDIICSFNVIEHFSSPILFMDMAQRHTGEETLHVLETPKFNSLTTHVQKVFPVNVHSHVMPYLHNHLFTDESLATFLYRFGLKPTDVWYFGQDVLETMAQFFHAAGSKRSALNLMDEINQLQAYVDRCHASDLMLFAAVPRS